MENLEELLEKHKVCTEHSEKLNKVTTAVVKEEKRLRNLYKGSKLSEKMQDVVIDKMYEEKILSWYISRLVSEIVENGHKKFWKGYWIGLFVGFLGAMIAISIIT